MAYEKRINIRLNTDMLDKEKYFHGKKHIMADLTLIPTPTNEFNDYMIVQDSKEKDADGKTVKGIIVGNAKDANFDKVNKQANPEPPKPAVAETDESTDESVPF
jgi:hypothetical protein